MIKYSLKDELVHLSIDKKDFSHRIPVSKIGKAMQWNIGKNGSEIIAIKNVSKWMLRLFTQQITDEKYITQFKSIIEEYCPNSNIDWKATMLALTIQNEYNSRLAQGKMNAKEIIAVLEEKYRLD
jgi:hypothetical protein